MNKDISLKLEQISENANYHILAKMKYRIDLKTKTKALLQMINPLQKRVYDDGLDWKELAKALKR